MDLTEALTTWDRIGNTTKSYDDKDNNYCIDFINKKGEAVGWVKVYPGQGIRWNYPDELFAETNHQPSKDCNIERQFLEAQLDDELSEADYWDGDASWNE